MDINLISYIQDVEYGYKPDIVYIIQDVEYGYKPDKVYTGCRIWI